ncbi:MAG TPA: glutamate racemase [Rhabdochlamydiaceae bacterium]|jgi:glutamate racemase
MNLDNIAILDSGFGGLTAMRHIRALMPNENIIYFGDTAHLPYGNKSPQTIVNYCLENIPFLLDKGIKILVIACHTACTAALPIVRKHFNILIVGIIEQGIEQAVQATQNQRIGVLGTRTTIASGVYQRQIQLLSPQAEIHALACPLFVPFVEEGYTDHPITSLMIADTLRPIKNKNIDTLLLGCTHYPLLEPLIQREFKNSVNIIDPAKGCALKTRQLLAENQLLNPQQTSPNYTFYVTDDPDKFRQLGKTFINYPIETVFKR